MTDTEFIGYREISGLGQGINVLQVYQIGCARYVEFAGELRPLYVGEGGKLSMGPRTESVIELKDLSRTNRKMSFARR